MNTTASSAISAPRTTYAGSTAALTDGCTGGTEKAGALPNRRRPTYVAVAVESATGTSVRTLTSCIKTSTAKRTPPSGVLNVAAMPGPPPAATSVARCQRDTRTSPPSQDANAALIWTIGPSRPTEPPLPIEMADATDLTTATTGLMTPLP